MTEYQFQSIGKIENKQRIVCARIPVQSKGKIVNKQRFVCDRKPRSKYR